MSLAVQTGLNYQLTVLTERKLKRNLKYKLHVGEFVLTERLFKQNFKCLLDISEFSSSNLIPAGRK